MRITKEGPSTRVEETCFICKSLLEIQLKDTGNRNDPNNSDTYRIECPVCGYRQNFQWRNNENN